MTLFFIKRKAFMKAHWTLKYLLLATVFFYGTVAYSEVQVTINTPDKYKDLIDCELNRSNALHLPNWFNDKQQAFYPIDSGFFRGSITATIEKGMLITRYGNPGGHFAAPDGVLWTERAMPLGSNVNLHKYKVLKDITVQEGLASPWFDQAGCGVQFQFSDSLKDLLDQNALVEIFDTKQQ